jgi:hypothetical protein
VKTTKHQIIEMGGGQFRRTESRLPNAPGKYCEMDRAKDEATDKRECRKLGRVRSATACTPKMAQEIGQAEFTSPISRAEEQCLEAHHDT